MFSYRCVAIIYSQETHRLNKDRMSILEKDLPKLRMLYDSILRASDKDEKNVALPVEFRVPIRRRLLSAGAQDHSSLSRRDFYHLILRGGLNADSVQALSATLAEREEAMQGLTADDEFKMLL